MSGAVTSKRIGFARLSDCKSAMVRRPMKLTDLELKVFRLMAKGVAVKAIGARIGISQKSVSSARRRVLRRNRVTNYLQLGILLERSKLLPGRRIVEQEERVEAQLAAL